MKLIPIILAAILVAEVGAASAPAPTPRYVGIVVDTSKSMRDPATGRILSSVVQAARDTLSIFPSTRFVRLVDADGRAITSDWDPVSTPIVVDAVVDQLARYSTESGKDPSKGLNALLTSLWDPPMYICVIGDEWTPPASDPVAAVAKLNPIRTGGVPWVRIGGIQVPTPAVRASSAGSVAFSMYMNRIATSSGGALTVLGGDSLRPGPPARTGDTVAFRMLQLDRNGRGDAALRAAAEALRDQALRGADFVDLVKKHSADSRAATGGEYPTYAAADIIADFRAPIFDVKPGGLQAGEITAPIIRPEGAYLLFILQRNVASPGAPTPAATSRKF